MKMVRICIYLKTGTVLARTDAAMRRVISPMVAVVTPTRGNSFTVSAHALWVTEDGGRRACRNHSVLGFFKLHFSCIRWNAKPALSIKSINSTWLCCGRTHSCGFSLQTAHINESKLHVYSLASCKGLDYTCNADAGRNAYPHRTVPRQRVPWCQSFEGIKQTPSCWCWFLLGMRS